MSEALQVATAVPNSIGVDKAAGYGRMRLILGLVFVISSVIAMLSLPTDVAGGWGMVTTTFIFLMGVTQFGVAFTAIMRLTGGFWARPLFRLAEVATLAWIPFAFIGLFVVFFGAREQLFFWLHPEPGEHLSSWLGENKLLGRNTIMLAIFYIFAFVYVRVGVQPDIDDDKRASAKGLRRIVLSLMGTARNHDPVARTQKLYNWSTWLLLVAALANTFIAWDFAMMLWPHYHSTVFTLYYMEGCIYGGIAGLLLLAALMRNYVNMDAVFGTRQIKNIGIMLTGFMCLWLYFFWAQYFVSWFGNLTNEMRPLTSQMEGHYAPLFWLSVACLFVLPLGLLIFAWVKRRLWSAAVVAALILTGIWLNRYLMVLPARWEEHIPFTTLGGTAGSVALLSGFLFVLVLLFDAFPMLSRWEIEHIPASQRAHWHSED